MWESKGRVRAIALIMIALGNYMAGNGLDFSTLPEILMTLGVPLGLLGVINSNVGKNK